MSCGIIWFVQIELPFIYSIKSFFYRASAQRFAWSEFQNASSVLISHRHKTKLGFISSCRCAVLLRKILFSGQKLLATSCKLTVRHISSQVDSCLQWFLGSSPLHIQTQRRHQQVILNSGIVRPSQALFTVVKIAKYGSVASPAAYTFISEVCRQPCPLLCHLKDAHQVMLIEFIIKFKNSQQWPCCSPSAG